MASTPAVYRMGIGAREAVKMALQRDRQINKYIYKDVFKKRDVDVSTRLLVHLQRSIDTSTRKNIAGEGGPRQ